MVQLVIVLLVASAIKRIVDVRVVAEIVLFVIVNEFPPEFKPSKVTLSAPFKFIMGLPAVVAPEIVRAAPPVGEITILVYNDEPPDALSAAVAVPSLVFPETPMVIVPVCVPAFMASKAPFNVV
jgi:hypothetical protein